MNFLGIKKNQIDLNFANALAERDNPGQRRAKQGSNQVMLFSMIVIAVAVAFLLIRNMTLGELNRNIAENKENLKDPYNIAMKAYKEALQAAINEIKGYNAASETFLDQLSKNKRFRMSWIEEYDQLFKNGVSPGTKLTNFSYDMQHLILDVETDSKLPMLKFITTLRELKDEDGNPRFHNVVNNSFSGDSTANLYQFHIEMDLWVTEAPKETAPPVVVEEEEEDLTKID